MDRLRGRKKVYIDESGKIVELRSGEKAPQLKKTTHLDSYGQIAEDFSNEKCRVLGETSDGEKLYLEDENGKEVEYLDYVGHGVPQKRIAVKQSILGPVINDYINYLISKKEVRLKRLDNSRLIFLEGELPGDSDEHGQKYLAKVRRIKLADGKEKELVVVDSNLKDEEKIAVIYHELVHARGISDEKKTQLETIYGLREMLKSYAGLMDDDEAQLRYFPEDVDQIEHGNVSKDPGKPVNIRKALNYAIFSRRSFEDYRGNPVRYKDIKSKFSRRARARNIGKLERAVDAMFFFVFIALIATIFASSMITGFVITDVPSMESRIVFMSSCIFLAVFTFYYIKTKKRKQFK